MKSIRLACVAALLTVTASRAGAETKVRAEHLPNDEAARAFPFKSIPPVRRFDAAAQARFQVLDGQPDSNGGGVERLHDGKLPRDEDEPGANFFFRAGTRGGRLLVDLGATKDLRQVNTFSWHAGTRGPQVYTLYAATGEAAGFEAQPAKGSDPLKGGWVLLAEADTRSAAVAPGGQHGVSIQAEKETLGRYRYLLFDIRPTEVDDAFGNTFFSEIDVVDSASLAEAAPESSDVPKTEEVIQAGMNTIALDTSETPELTDWVKKHVIPMATEWYPKLVEMFPSEGYAAPRRVRITFSADMDGVAATSGTRVRCAGKWFRQNLEGEALGAIFHELVHVVQQYGNAPRRSGGTRAPGWLVEGIADYTRWYRFEPQSRGAEITSRNLARARYDGNYRISANFLNWVTESHNKELVPRLNAAIREGRYTEDLWKDLTKSTVQDLGAAWRADLEKRLGS